jgi:hypothetical protein
MTEGKGGGGSSAAREAGEASRWGPITVPGAWIKRV